MTTTAMVSLTTKTGMTTMMAFQTLRIQVQKITTTMAYWMPTTKTMTEMASMIEKRSKTETQLQTSTTMTTTA